MIEGEESSRQEKSGHDLPPLKGDRKGDRFSRMAPVALSRDYAMGIANEPASSDLVPRKKEHGSGYLPECHHGSERSGQISNEVLDVEATQKTHAAELDPETSWRSGRQVTHQDRTFLMMISGVLLVGICLGSAWFIVMTRPKSAEPMDNTSTVVASADEVSPFYQEATTDELIESGTSSVKGFMAAKSLEERCRFVVGGERMLEKMEDFYQRPENALPTECEVILENDLGAHKGRLILSVVARDRTGEIHVFPMIAEGERLLIHWEAAVAYSELSWETILQTRPEEEVLMRVYLQRRPADGPGFQDELVSLGLRNDLVKRVVCLAPDSQAAEFLLPLFDQFPTDWHPVTCYLQWNKKNACPEVTRVKHLLWIDLSNKELR